MLTSEEIGDFGRVEWFWMTARGCVGFFRILTSF
jgi:hypothetical protein